MTRVFLMMVVTGIGLAGFLTFHQQSADESNYKSDVEAISLDDIRRRPAIPKKSENGEGQPAPLPQAVNLDIPFFAQAPDADWNLPWKEACEEASIVLAHYFITGKELSKNQFKQDILNLADYQTEKWGHYIDTGIDRTAEMYGDYFSTDQYEVIDNPTAEDIKRALANGYPVVAPFAGRELGNPFYSGQGPYYHMLVIKGYDERGNFITNDVGTSRGENFIYPVETILSAMTDWGTLDLAKGVKKVLVIRPPVSSSS